MPDLVYMGYCNSTTNPPTREDLKLRLRSNWRGHLEYAHWVLDNINILDWWCYWFSNDYYHCYAEFDPSDLSLLLIGSEKSEEYLKSKDTLFDLIRMRPW